MSKFTIPFGYQEGTLPIEKNRYRLIQAKVCPFAHRAVITRELLGLEGVISLGTASSIKSKEGWAFTLDENERDPVLGVQYVKDIYLNSDPEYNGPFAVPVLTDETTGTIARKESAEIVRDFYQDFKPLHDEDAPNLYPIEKKNQVDHWNERISAVLLGNVYKMGTTENSEEYETLTKEYFDLLDEIDAHLANQRYLNGDRITESDIFLYTPLVRLEVAYSPLFKADKKKLTGYPNLWPYLRDLYQTKGFGSTTDFEAIQAGYFDFKGSEIPEKLIISDWEKPHHRESLTS